MKLVIRQIYIEPGIVFHVPWTFENYLEKVLAPLLAPSKEFVAKYADGFSLVFNVSAKQGIVENEIRGPTVFKRTKDVEYTIFLPFDFIMKTEEPYKMVVRLLLDGICDVCSRLKIDSSVIADQKEAILANPDMVKPPGELGEVE